MFVTGVVDKAANLQLGRSPRIREGEHGPEYVVAWGSETAHGRDIVITKIDIDNLMRAKAAIYAGFTVMAQSVGVDLGDVFADADRRLVRPVHQRREGRADRSAARPACAPGRASPWDRFRFLGNTSIRGAYMALLRRDVRVAAGTRWRGTMTYLELSADNSFLRRVHLGAVPAAHRCVAVPIVQRRWRPVKGPKPVVQDRSPALRC